MVIILKNKLRLTIGSKKENLKFMSVSKASIEKMKNILIIGCGLLGSSLLRRISKKKIAKKIFIL